MTQTELEPNKPCPFCDRRTLLVAMESKNEANMTEDISEFCGAGERTLPEVSEAMNSGLMFQVPTLAEIRAEALKFYATRFDNHQALVPQTLHLMIRMVDAVHATQTNGAAKMDLERLEQAIEAASVIRQLDEEIVNTNDAEQCEEIHLNFKLAGDECRDEILKIYRSVLSAKLEAARKAFERL